MNNKDLKDTLEKLKKVGYWDCYSFNLLWIIVEELTKRELSQEIKSLRDGE